jgi:N,N'-diacetyllegionaminate synthase
MIFNDNRTIIIAEAGVNHNGNMDLAFRLIDLAAKAGADIVKFQTFSASRLVTKNAAKAYYQVNTTGANESQLEMLQSLELTSSMHDELIAHAAKRKIVFMSTAFDEESLNLLLSKGLRHFKVPSGELTNLAYLRRIAVVAEDVIISTGMATLEDVRNAIAVFDTAGFPRDRLIVLHCTSDYPAPIKDVNLRAMLTLAREFGVKVGYSDHTEGIEIPIAATALGASVIEKHFTIDRSLPGPDHKASLEPDQLVAMVSAIRNINLAMGDGIKRPSPTELKNSLVVRKSLVAINPIKCGEIFNENNIGSKRPGTGISPMLLESVLGAVAKRDFNTDDLIEI